MTAFKRATPASYGADRAITASAARVNITDRNETDAMRLRNTTSSVWQQEAWTYYDAIGEIKFAYGLVAAVASRVRLYVGVVVDPDSAPVAIADAVVDPETDNEDEESSADDGIDARRERAVDPELAERAEQIYIEEIGETSVSTMMRNLALNLNVPGECLFVKMPDKKWYAKSTSECRVAGDGRMTIQRSVSESPNTHYLPDGTPVGRVWREHPQYSKDPDSAMVAIRSDCEELLLLSRMIRTITRSRLNAGILYVPEEISVVARSTPDDGTEESELEADPIETELMYAMLEPIASEASAASVVPMLMRGPAELGDKIKYITLERKSDQFLIERAVVVLERILASLDVPKDIVTGLANVKYSNAIQIDESLYKAHVEPLMLMIADAFTDIILRPALTKAGLTDEEARQFVVWYDPSDVLVRPNRAQDADRGYEKMVLSGKAWRDANGFAETDAPDPDEVAFRLAVDKAVIPPEIATLLYNKLLPGLTKEARSQALEDGVIPPELEGLLDSDSAVSAVPSEEGEVPAEEAPLEEAVPAEAPIEEEVPV